MSDNISKEQIDLPLLPLRDVVVFPHMVIPLFVGRPKSIKALETSMESGKSILLVAQKTAAQDDPTPEDLYDTGSVATVLQMLKLPDGTVKVLVEGNQRARVLEVTDVGTHLAARAEILPAEGEELVEVEAMRRALLTQFDQYVKLNKKIPPEVLTSLSGIDEGGRLADTIVAHLPLKLEQKQEVLEMIGVNKRLEHLLGLLEGELDILQVEKRIRGRVKRQMEKSQREYYLNEQVKAIQKELGDIEEGAELEELEKRIKQASMSKEAEAKAMGELKKLRMMSPMSAEATVIRSYIEAMVGLPWKKKTKISKDLAKAEKVLDQDHYGLDKVKERILEYLAVQQRVDKVKAPILCLVGPPGVGKTSLVEMLARRFHGTKILEDVDNPFLPDFYKKKKGAAFQTQLFFLLSRYRQQQELAQQDLFQQSVVADYLFDRDRIFAYLNLDDNEESRRQRQAYTTPVRALIEPLDEAFFAGKVDLSQLSLTARLMARAAHSPVGDLRDWTAIRAWAERLEL